MGSRLIITAFLHLKEEEKKNNIIIKLAWGLGWVNHLSVLFLVCVGAAITVLVLAASEISVTLNNGSIYCGLIA